MSIQARQTLVKKLIFQRDSQRADLLDPQKTKTQLIALLTEITKFYPLEITAVRSDHHDDSEKGEHCHANGYAVDCWPLRSNQAEDYAQAESGTMSSFLRYAAASPWLHQIGLGGSADTETNRGWAGPTCFEDSNEDHVHISAQ